MELETLLDFPEHTRSKRRRYSHDDTDVYRSRKTHDDTHDRDFMRAKIALEYYNKENGTKYVLAGAFSLSNDFVSDGIWVHCNFAAWQPDREMMLGIATRKLFFAEMLRDVATHSPMTETWTVTCCIVLEGNITAGCSFCTDVIHPNHGFRQGHAKPKFLFQPTTYSSASYLPTSFQPTTYSSASYLPTSFQPTTHLQTSYQPTTNSRFSYPLSLYMPTPEELKPYEDELRGKSFEQYARPERMEPSELRRTHAESAVEFYNMDHGTNYEVVDTLLSNALLQNRSWYHINFTAKPPNEDISPKRFFAEIYGADSYGVSACHMLDGETTRGCKWCSDVIHPTHGFSSRVRTYGAQTSINDVYQPRPKLISPVN